MGENAAEGGECGDDVVWSLDTVTGLLTVSGTGAMENYNAQKSPLYKYRDAIRSAEIGSGGTSGF